MHACLVLPCIAALVYRCVICKCDAISGLQAPDEADLYIPPTVVLNPSNAKCMLLTEEVFGPVLPVIQYDDLDAVLRTEAALPNPLVLF